MPGPERRYEGGRDRRDPYSSNSRSNDNKAALAAQAQAAIQAAAAQAAQAAAAMAAAQAQQAVQAQMQAPMPTGQHFIKVSQNSNPKQVAGKIAHTCREGDPPAILTIGSGCINQAVKAVSIARGGQQADACLG